MTDFGFGCSEEAKQRPTRIRRLGGEDARMRRVLTSFETSLLRKSVERLAAGREDCADCARTPLVGERVHVYEDGTIVCSLCRTEHRGEPQTSRLVRHSELGHTVKPVARLAA